MQHSIWCALKIEGCWRHSVTKVNETVSLSAIGRLFGTFGASWLRTADIRRRGVSCSSIDQFLHTAILATAGVVQASNKGVHQGWLTRCGDADQAAPFSGGRVRD